MASGMSSSLAAQIEALSLDETPSETHPETRPALVNCFPFPPVEEYRKPRSTGIYYYGIYIREGALEAYAKRVNPEAEKYHFSQQQMYAVDYMRWIVNDQSLDIQIAVLRRRHKRAMPIITERYTAQILCLFRFGEEAYKKRMSAENVEKLADALGCKPDWFEIFFFS
ncbi:hypothetical protein C8Q74DRAFT_1365172 [Fomes fomentarius]|nr:hypothetical protein C8Q74DRAFT_1365172 [Fomes fomentarius]